MELTARPVMLVGGDAGAANMKDIEMIFHERFYVIQILHLKLLWID